MEIREVKNQETFLAMAEARVVSWSNQQDSVMLFTSARRVLTRLLFYILQSIGGDHPPATCRIVSHNEVSGK
jgi:hypothetical protein